jgi:hypothetical protein
VVWVVHEFFGWFSDGFDSPDLQNAKALLVDLARTAGSRARHHPAG